MAAAAPPRPLRAQPCTAVLTDLRGEVTWLLLPHPDPSVLNPEQQSKPTSGARRPGCCCPAQTPPCSTLHSSPNRPPGRGDLAAAAPPRPLRAQPCTAVLTDLLGEASWLLLPHPDPSVLNVPCTAVLTDLRGEATWLLLPHRDPSVLNPAQQS